MDAEFFQYALVIAFITFLGITFWAYNKKREPAFDEAANLPFALPDEEELAKSRKVGASNE